MPIQDPRSAATVGMPLAELIALARQSTTTTLPIAGRAHGIGSNLSYELFRQGLFPCRVLRLGRKLVVPTADLLISLGINLSSDTASMQRHVGGAPDDGLS